MALYLSLDTKTTNNMIYICQDKTFENAAASTNSSHLWLCLRKIWADNNGSRADATLIEKSDDADESRRPDADLKRVFKVQTCLENSHYSLIGKWDKPAHKLLIILCRHFSLSRSERHGGGNKKPFSLPLLFWLSPLNYTSVLLLPTSSEAQRWADSISMHL